MPATSALARPSAFAYTVSAASRAAKQAFYLLSSTWGVSLMVALLLVLGFSWASYLAHQLYLDLLCSRGQDLKKKYKAQWALVTGASSGIGKALAWECARQGLNVVMVALPDKMFDATFRDIQSAFPSLSFRKVPVNLGKHGDYMPAIADATDDIDVQVVFNNAGYMKWGFFVKTAVGDQMANLECNTTSAVCITHHFVTRMVSKGLPGCVVFTSSAAAAIPSPFSVLYASTKSFLSSFGASLAAEVKSKGVDVLVIHPSPVATRFYDAAKHGTSMVDFFAQFAVQADALPAYVFGAVGRTVWRDVGLTAICFRLMAKFLDYNFLATVTASTAHTMGDYRALEAAGTPAPTPAPTPATTPRATSPTVSPRRGRGGSRARK